MTNPSLAMALDSITAAALLQELLQREEFHAKNNELIALRKQEGLWFHYTQEKCRERLGFSRKQQETAIKILEKQGLIKKVNYGLPCKRHFQINQANFLEFFDKYVKSKVKYKRPAKQLSGCCATPKKSSSGSDPANHQAVREPALSEKERSPSKAVNSAAYKKQYSNDTHRQETIAKQSSPKNVSPKSTSSVPKAKSSHSNFPKDRHLPELEALSLNTSQKRTLYGTFDDQRLLQAIAYYRAFKKEPTNLGGFLYQACQNEWKQSATKQDKLLANKKLTLEKFGKYEDINLQGQSVSIHKDYVMFSTICGSSCLNYEENDFATKLDHWLARVKPHYERCYHSQ